MYTVSHMHTVSICIIEAHTSAFTHSTLRHTYTHSTCWPVSHCCHNWFPFLRVTPVTTAIESPIFQQSCSVSLSLSSLMTFFFVFCFKLPFFAFILFYFKCLLSFYCYVPLSHSHAITYISSFSSQMFSQTKIPLGQSQVKQENATDF